MIMMELDTIQHVPHGDIPNAPIRILKPSEMLERWKQGGSVFTTASIDDDSASLTKLGDYVKLATSAKRAGKSEQEANAIYCMGIIHDNLGNYSKAIEMYTKYLNICNTNGDEVGRFVAENSLGVSYYYMAHSKKNSRITDLENAIMHHTLHMESQDELDQLVALTNLGLCYLRLNQPDKACEFHRKALELSIVVSDLEWQSITVGNLAIASQLAGDLPTAKACMEKHMILSRDLNQFVSEIIAMYQLGQMCCETGDYEHACTLFDEAQALAMQHDAPGLVRTVKCSIGITRGNMDIVDYFEKIAK